MGTFSNVFKTLRIDRGLTQEQLAEQLKITKQAVSHYERGTREPKNQEMYEAIADFFNVDMNYLLGGTTTSLNITDDELRIINAYRQSSNEIKQAVRAVLGIGR
jgi:transcriptional regulator with XRE-family HTH domain